MKNKISIENKTSKVFNEHLELADLFKKYVKNVFWLKYRKSISTFESKAFCLNVLFNCSQNWSLASKAKFKTYYFKCLHFSIIKENSVRNKKDRFYRGLVSISSLSESQLNGFCFQSASDPARIAESKDSTRFILKNCKKIKYLEEFLEYLEGETLNSLARKFKVSRERIRQRILTCKRKISEKRCIFNLATLFGLR